MLYSIHFEVVFTLKKEENNLNLGVEKIVAITANNLKVETSQKEEEFVKKVGIGPYMRQKGPFKIVLYKYS